LPFLVEQLFHDALKKGQVPIYSNRKPEIGKPCSRTDKGRQRLDRVPKILRIRILKAKVSGLGKWIDADDLGPFFFGMLQRSQHAGVIGSRILSDHENSVGLQEIIQSNRS